MYVETACRYCLIKPMLPSSKIGTITVEPGWRTGYAAGEMIPLGKTYLLPAYSDELTYVYLARVLKKTSQDLDSDEIIDVHRLPLDHVLEMISSGDIIDALSILAIYHAVRYLDWS